MTPERTYFKTELRSEFLAEVFTTVQELADYARNRFERGDIDTSCRWT